MSGQRKPNEQQQDQQANHQPPTLKQYRNQQQGAFLWCTRCGQPMQDTEQCPHCGQRRCISCGE
jgi:rubrerythrin